MASKRNAKISGKSQGDRTVQCVRCSGDIAPYAGRAVDLLSKYYAHHLGKCPDRTARETAMHATAQLEMFGWSCGKITPDLDYGRAPITCIAAGSNRDEYTAHMHAHGLRTLTAPAMIRLRKSAPAAKLAPIAAPKPFKMLSWIEHYPQSDGPDIPVERRGQFWSNGPDAHSVWAVTYTAPGSGIRPELVKLWVAADGSVTRNYSDAASTRREANRVARRAAESCAA